MIPTPDGEGSLASDIEQQCYAVRRSVAYDAEGREKDGSWGFIESISDTRYTFASVLWQKYVEEIFRKRLEQVGVTVKQPHRFEDLVIDEDVPAGEIGRVRARIIATATSSTGEEVEEEYFVRARYVIGCDGSRTKVRGAAGIDSVGDRSEEKWVRIDGVFKSTTMPKPRCYGAIESEEYGNVLWIPLDHGATRLGFAFNEERRKRYGSQLTEEVFVREAKECVKPFEIEYEKVDWASVYSVGQRLAKTFWNHGCVFLAGDSAHTHSSGAGQGMNAGVHDAVNLGWKLAGVLMGKLKEAVLETYDLERRPNAERLIKYDEEISMLVSGRWPKGKLYEERKERGEDISEALTRVLRGAKGFNTGLTIRYEPNTMIWSEESVRDGEIVREEGVTTPALPGWRAPDVKFVAPAMWNTVWLQSELKNRAQFHIVLFLGQGDKGREHFRTFKKAVEEKFVASENIANTEINGQVNGHANGYKKKRPELPVRYITILPQTVDNGWHDLQTDPLGRVYYDGDGSAGQRYGVNVESGSIFLARPDGWLGAKLRMDEHAPGEILRYFEGILLSS